jgi:hypothetical protein
MAVLVEAIAVVPAHDDIDSANAGFKALAD